MQRIDVPSAVAVLPAPQATAAPGYFSNGNLAAGQPPTTVTNDFLNSLQEELASVILAAGLVLDKTSNTQLLTAIQHFATGAVSAGTATTTVAGLIKLATQAMALAGTDATTAMTPADVAAAIQSAPFCYSADTGAANALVATLAPAPPSTAAGFALRIKVANANTGAVTIAVNGAAAAPVVFNGAPLISGMLQAGSIYALIADGAGNWTLQTPPANAAGAVVTGSGTGYRWRWDSRDGSQTVWLTRSIPLTNEGAITVQLPVVFDQIDGTFGTVINALSTNNQNTNLQEVTTTATTATMYVQDYGNPFSDANGGFRLRVDGHSAAAPAANGAFSAAALHP